MNTPSLTALLWAAGTVLSTDQQKHEKKNRVNKALAMKS